MSGIKNPHLSVDFCVATGEILLTEHSIHGNFVMQVLPDPDVKASKTGFSG